MPPFQPGESLPDITLPDQHGRAVSLRSFLGGPLILYFYPEDDTPSCTKQACQFRDLSLDFRALGASIVGISPDPHAKHARFDHKHALGFTLLADEPIDGVPPVCRRFGAWGHKSMYGRAYMGVIRTTYLIRADGTVAHRWDAVRVPGHADDVLNALRELATGAAVTLPSVKPATKATPRTSAARKPAAKKPSAKKPSAKKPSAKKPAAKKPAAKKSPKRSKSTRPASR